MYTNTHPGTRGQEQSPQVLGLVLCSPPSLLFEQLFQLLVPFSKMIFFVLIFTKILGLPHRQH